MPHIDIVSGASFSESPLRARWANMDAWSDNDKRASQGSLGYMPETRRVRHATASVLFEGFGEELPPSQRNSTLRVDLEAELAQQETLKALLGESLYNQHTQHDHNQHTQQDHNQHTQQDHNQHTQQDHNQHTQQDHNQHTQQAHNQHTQQDHNQHTQQDHNQHTQQDHNQHTQQDHNENNTHHNEPHNEPNHNSHHNSHRSSHRSSHHNEPHNDPNTSHNSQTSHYSYNSRNSHPHSHNELDPQKPRAQRNSFFGSISNHSSIGSMFAKNGSVTSFFANRQSERPLSTESSALKRASYQTNRRASGYSVTSDDRRGLENRLSGQSRRKSDYRQSMISMRTPIIESAPTVEKAQKSPPKSHPTWSSNGHVHSHTPIRRKTLGEVPNMQERRMSMRKSMSDMRKSFVGIFTSNHQRLSSSPSLISLPKPTDESLQRFYHKLHASPSVLSLSLDTKANSRAAPVAEASAQTLESLLSLCHQVSPLPLKELSASLHTKVGTDSIGELFVAKGQTLAQASHVYRLSRLGGPAGMASEELVLRTFKELCVIRALANLDGFTSAQQTWVAQDGSGELVCVIAFPNVGESLASKRISWADGLDCFWQVARALAQAEQLCQFEHRDLRPASIYVRKDAAGRMVATVGGLHLARAQYLGETIFTRLDDGQFFASNGDTHHAAVLSQMHRLVGAQSKWPAYEPRTNVLWLHALARHLASTCDGGCIDLRRKLIQLEHSLQPDARWRLGFRALSSAQDVVKRGKP